MRIDMDVSGVRTLEAFWAVITLQKANKKLPAIVEDKGIVAAGCCSQVER